MAFMEIVWNEREAGIDELLDLAIMVVGPIPKGMQFYVEVEDQDSEDGPTFNLSLHHDGSEACVAWEAKHAKALADGLLDG